MSPADDRRTANPSAPPPHVTVLEGPDPSSLYSAGVLSYPLSLVAGSQKAPTREGALEALKARLAELGRPAELSVFDSLEAAREEVRRRSAAGELRAAIAPAYRARVAALVPDRPDLIEALDALDYVLGGVARGRHNPEPAPVKDGKIVCHACGAYGTPEGRRAAYAGYGFRATADALVTVDMTDKGETQNISDPEVQIDPRGFRELVCRWCESDLPDLPAEDFYRLRGAARDAADGAP